MSSVKPITKSSDMSNEMVMESTEVIVMSVDKHQATKNYEVRAKEYILTF